jgi:Heterokaryon incompatibility protein Het-C
MKLHSFFACVQQANKAVSDIEDTLLALLITRAGGGRKFSKLDVKRVYFGNWLRDYSQAVDVNARYSYAELDITDNNNQVGSVKYVSAEAVRLIVWVLGFMSFGLGTREFEVTRDRLGCYRPEEHIDNPKGTVAICYPCFKPS